MNEKACPNCGSEHYIKSGVVNHRQRYKCKDCSYFFTVFKDGKKIDDYYVNKALQLYLEGLTYREIERILGVSHVSVMNWVKKYRVKRPENTNYHPSYRIFSATELSTYFSNPENLRGAGNIVTELGDKFMLIKWERFRE
ncbi:helix-turn-helix domain-containing protein [Paracrocinitomix mangrovi]|uniref:transposase-like zinc-binding domain-containing protein n=1 Tax=Paracrocinitomix mangrovi TaxID=2862509 RepID=UPI001C8E0D7F|nr:helix-turn-helix domain-containing protein [Paracrocinitomix mangrovi]